MKLLKNADDVSDHILVLVANTVEDRYPPEEPGGMPEDDFIDYLCKDQLNLEGIDIEELDTPATRKIMRHARRVRSEMA